ncbi:MAG: CBS domain-containing protein [Thermodesulfovibrionales bacterium]|nr:CBS domain-containing protein [Thermodesulfovibrionales bacterium]
MDVIASHINADFDSFASMVAAKKLYPRAELVFPGSQGKKVRDFIDAFHPVDIKRLKEIDFSSITRLILVDTKSPERIGQLADLIGKKGMKIHVYDHHPRTEGDIKGHAEVIEEVGATVTIFTEMLKEKAVRLSPMEATIMSLGIYEETGNLLFPTTTERDVQALAYLLKCGASLKIVAAYMKTELSREELDLLNELMQTSTEVIIHGVKIKIAKASRDEYYGDAAHFAHRIMDMEDTDALVLMLSMEGKVLMVGRSSVPELDIAEVLEEFGGGGHSVAASATVKEVPLEVLQEKLLGLLNSAVKPRKVAGDMMTRPVVTIDSEAAVKEAESMMTKYGVNVLPVVSSGKFIGIISREVVEKSLFLGFRASRVIDFTTTDISTVGKDTPVRDVEAAMIEQNQRFMPVIEDGAIAGAITRTDLLRLMYEESLSRSRVKEVAGELRGYPGKSLASVLKEKFPEEIYEILRLSGEIAAELGQNAYMVGGSVRDILRGEKNLDIDIVVEGDGIAFAKELARRLGAKVRTHEKFGTAKIIKGGLKFDVATARTEHYEFPAALPTVETSSVKKDLYRRDFTINTLAVKLNPLDFGRLVDFFGGQRDIRDKSIRVLHNLSFVEDPTRAFRAVRFAERFGFKLSKHTENIIKTAVKMNLMERLSGSRLYEELLIVFNEPEPEETLKRLAGYDLLKAVHPALKWTGELGGILTALHESLLWFNLSFMEEKPDRGVLYLSALVSALKDEDKEAVLERLAVSPKLKETVIKCVSGAKGAVRLLPLNDPAAVYDAFSVLPLETALFAMALAKEPDRKKEITRYLLELRKQKPILTGNDLKGMGIAPGPLYSRILKELLHERLRGNLRSMADEEDFVKGHFTA